jgi:RNA polymerase sigma-70 factor (ECF subfamily)
VTPEQTDWHEIAALYRELLRLAPTPIVELNYAVAVAMSVGFEKGLALIDQLGASGALTKYHLFHAARADLLRRLKRRPEAIEAYEKAIALVTNRVEEAYLRRRLAQLNG